MKKMNSPMLYEEKNLITKPENPFQNYEKNLLIYIFLI